eukprot:gene5462-5696_t
MAFSFGASTSSAPAFGTPQSTPAFGAPSTGGFSFGAAASAPAFGASSTPAFGAATSTPAFGTPGSTPAFGTPGSTPAFGTPTSTPAFGAASSAPAFGAPSSTPAFGASSTPAFGAAASTGGFNFSTTPSTGLFGQSAGQQQASSAPSFSFNQPQQQQPQQPPQQVPFTHATRFEELDKTTQDMLTQIQDVISKYESDRLKVSQLLHLLGQTALPQGLDADTSGLSSELRMLQATIKAEQDNLADFREKAIKLLKSTETVVRTYERTKLWRDRPAMYQRQEPLKPAQQELLAQPVLLPGPFLEEAVVGFSSNCGEYSRCLEEVEQVLAASSLGDLSTGSIDWVTALPTIVANLHDYFVAVAAKLERLHSEVTAAAAGGLFGSPQPATPAAPGFGGAPFGSPFVSTASLAAPFGGAAAAGGLSRSSSSSKGRSGKKR